jgi:hypothetical protein
LADLQRAYGRYQYASVAEVLKKAMKSNSKSELRGTARLGKLETRLAAAEATVQATRKKARLAKQSFKEARKAFKLAKKAAKLARKELKDAAKDSKSVTRSKVKKTARPTRHPNAKRKPAQKAVVEARTSREVQPSPEQA